MSSIEKVFYKPDIVEFKNFLSKEECIDIINFFNCKEELWQQGCFYKSSTIDPGAPFDTYTGKSIDRNFFKDLISKINVLANEIAGQELYNLTMSGHKWLPDSFAPSHSDNTELDGTPNAWRDNKYATIIYLNEDYSGGELTFEKHDLEISPREGSLMVFDPGFNNIHGVNKVINGIRYTILSSWNFKNEHNQSDHEKLLLERQQWDSKKEEQRKNWEKGII